MNVLFSGSTHNGSNSMNYGSANGGTHKTAALLNYLVSGQQPELQEAT
jgi:hypothetical protein